MPDLTDVRHQDNAPYHPGEGTLAAYLDGALPEIRVEEVERHLEECRACRALLAGTVRVLAGETTPRHTNREKQAEEEVVWETTGPTGTGHRVGPRRYGRLITYALAASIVVILLARGGGPPSIDQDPRVRTPSADGAPAEGLSILAALRPLNGDTVAGTGLTFIWGASSAQRYHFVLANDEGTPVWTVDTPDTSLALPDSIALLPARVYFWHADAMRGGLAATTRLQRFTTARAP